MPLTNETTTATFDGNASVVHFPFNFRVWAATDLEVVLTDSNGAETVATNWTVALTEDGGTVTYPAVGGSPLPYGWKLTVRRAMPFTQPASYTDGGRFSSQAVGIQLDRQTAMLQQMREELSRTVKAGVAGVSPDTLLNTINSAVTSTSAAAAAATAAQAAAEAAAAEAAAAAAAAEAAAGYPGWDVRFTASGTQATLSLCDGVRFYWPHDDVCHHLTTAAYLSLSGLGNGVWHVYLDWNGGTPTQRLFADAPVAFSGTARVKPKVHPGNPALVYVGSLAMSGGAVTVDGNVALCCSQYNRQLRVHRVTLNSAATVMGYTWTAHMDLLQILPFTLPGTPVNLRWYGAGNVTAVNRSLFPAMTYGYQTTNWRGPTYTLYLTSTDHKVFLVDGEHVQIAYQDELYGSMASNDGTAVQVGAGATLVATYMA